MAKKKKKQVEKRQNQNKSASKTLTWREEHMSRVYHGFMKELKERGKWMEDITADDDYDSLRVRRRISATSATIKVFEERFRKICPVVPDGFSFEDDWIEANARPRPAYDFGEKFENGMLGVAIWILDNIREQGDMQAVAELLTDNIFDQDLIEDSIPCVWDLCHGEEILLRMLAVLQNRNKDCVGLRKEDQYENSSIKRFYFDNYTVANKHRQDVPSRKLFENILSYIPQEAIDRAVNMYMDKYWDIVDRYFKSRVHYAREEEDICARLDRNTSRSNSAFMELINARQSRKPLPSMRGPWLPAGMQGFPLALPQEQSGEGLAVDIPYQALQTIEQMKKEKEILEERWDEIGDRINNLWVSSIDFLFRTKEQIVKQFGEEVADIWDGVEIEDPYALCFGFLYLIEQGSDYPLLYYPGVTLFAMITSSLPWTRTTFEDSLEGYACVLGVWEHYDPDAKEIVPGSAKVALPEHIELPELEKWNRLQYLDRYEDEQGHKYKVSLSQIVYKITGCIMPRNLQRYYPTLLDLDDYGITGKETVHPLIYCMSLLGEGKRQSHYKPRMKENMEDQPEESVQEMSQRDSKEELEARIEALQDEVKRLKQTAYQAKRELREAKKEQAEREQRAIIERQELSDLRDLVFRLQEGVHEDEVEDTSIKFPYHNHQRVVVFGGHDSWTREIKPRLPDVRFVDRDMLPNAELIRRASIVWIQANAISHAYYYKILDETRKYNIPVRYFSYASALKCAEQLAEQDMMALQK